MSWGRHLSRGRWRRFRARRPRALAGCGAPPAQVTGPKKSERRHRRAFAAQQGLKRTVGRFCWCTRRTAAAPHPKCSRQPLVYLAPPFAERPSLGPAPPAADLRALVSPRAGGPGINAPTQTIALPPLHTNPYPKTRNHERQGRKGAGRRSTAWAPVLARGPYLGCHDRVRLSLVGRSAPGRRALLRPGSAPAPVPWRLAAAPAGPHQGRQYACAARPQPALAGRAAAAPAGSPPHAPRRCC